MLVKHMLEVPSHKTKHRHDGCHRCTELSTTTIRQGADLTTIPTLDMPAAL